MPTNLYGPSDNFDPTSSHVLPGADPALPRGPAYECPEVVLWGSGTPRREFLHVDDLADACVHLLESTTRRSRSTSASART